MANLKAWTGTASELITPFSTDGGVVLDLVAKEVNFMAERGVVGVMLNGFASEALMINDDDRYNIAKVAQESAPDGFNIMGNVIAGSVAEGIKWVRRYEELELESIAIATPPLYPYGVDSLVDYYITIANSTELPAYVYNSPEWANKLPPEDVARIIEASPNVVGYKDATHSLIELQTLFQIIGKDRLSVLSGSDALTVPMMLTGGTGVISLITTVFPELIVEMVDAATDRNWERAMALQDKVMRVRSALKVGPFMAAYKYVARLIGEDLGVARAPLRDLSEEQKEQVKTALEREGML